MCPYFTAGKQRLCLLCDVQSNLEMVLNMSVTLHLHCCLVALLHFGLKESMMYIYASNPHHQSEWLTPWFTPHICQDHKNRGLVHSWDAVCIRELWSQVQFWPWIVSGSNETGSETGLSRHSDLPCAVTGWRHPETQSTLISLFEATQWLSQYLKPQMSGCHPYTKH